MIEISIHWSTVLYYLLISIGLGYLTYFFVKVFRVIKFKEDIDEKHRHDRSDENFCFVAFSFWPFSLFCFLCLSVTCVFDKIDEDVIPISRLFAWPAIFTGKLLLAIFSFKETAFWKKITMTKKMKDIRAEAMQAIKSQQEKNPIFQKENENV